MAHEQSLFDAIVETFSAIPNVYLLTAIFTITIYLALWAVGASRD